MAFGVSRQRSIYRWMRRYEEGGLPALAERSHRPRSCPHQLAPALEATVLEMRRVHRAGDRPEAQTGHERQSEKAGGEVRAPRARPMSLPVSSARLGDQLRPPDLIQAADRPLVIGAGARPPSLSDEEQPVTAILPKLAVGDS